MGAYIQIMIVPPVKGNLLHPFSTKLQNYCLQHSNLTTTIPYLPTKSTVI